MPKDLDGAAWLKKRRTTFLAFLLETCALGMEYSLTFITLWMYLKDVVKTTNLTVFYSIISAIYLTSQVLMSVIFGRIFDRYRNARFMIFIGNLLVISGNVLYTVPFSPWYLFFGRLISGGGGCLRSIMTSELVRSYEESKLSAKFSSMGLAFASGFVLGPLLNIPFARANFTIFHIPITYANAPGLILAFVFILLQFFTFFMIQDLSKEHDMKKHLMNEEELSQTENLLKNINGREKDDDEDENIFGEANNDQNSISQFEALKKMLKNGDILLLLFLSFFFMYCMVLFDLWLPMAATELLQYGVKEINYIILGFGICAVGQLVFFSLRPINKENLVYFAMFCMVGMILDYAIFLTLKYYHSNKEMNIFLLVVWDVLAANIIAMEEVFLIVTMSTKISSSVQTFCESIRLAFSRTGAIVALLTAASAFEFMTATGVMCICVLLISLVILVCKRGNLQKELVLI